MENKNAIITGAAGGIGRAIVKKFASLGINIWACVRNEREDFTDYIKDMEFQYNVWIKPVYFDLTDNDALKNSIKNIIKEKKSIDVLVLNAGISPRDVLMMTRMDDLRKTMEINFFSQMEITQMVSKVMVRQQSGNIITVGSVSGNNYAEKGGLSYGTSKSALMFATRVISKELADFNIRVNSVAPGFINTSMWAERSDAMRDEASKRCVMKRMGNPVEVANVVSFLISDEASYLTGVNIDVCGGGRITLDSL